jgi:putative glutamine amidotransferase
MPVIACTTTDPSQHGNYVTWLRSLRGDVDLRFITSVATAPSIMAEADGLLLPGGVDPDPSLYGREDARALCNVEAERDAIEWLSIRIAVDRGLPILGICRGLQIATVAFGGTLIPDLPTAGYDGHHRLGSDDRLHEIVIERDSVLEAISGERGGLVNSAHHQGVEIIPPRFAVSARSTDGLPEALEWAQPLGKPFLLLLHWHPERLPAGHPLKDCIGNAFLSACGEKAPQG